MSYEFPKKWVEIGLERAIQSFDSGKRPKGGVRGINDGIPSLGGEHLNSDGGFNLESIKYVPVEFYEKMTKGHIEIGDILVVKDGATTGKTSFVSEKFPFKKAVVNEHVFILRCSKELLPSYVFRYLWSEEGQRKILANFQGSAQGGINRNFIKNVTVPLAPLNEQRRIVAKLDQMMPRIEAVKARLERIPLLLKRFRQSVLTAAVTGKLTEQWREEHPEVESADDLYRRHCESLEYVKNRNTQRVKSLKEPERGGTLPEIPDSWKWIKLNGLGELARGKSKHRPRNAPHLFGGQYPFIQTGDIAQSNGRIISHNQTYSEEGLAQSRLWPKGTICITIAANIANSAILTYPACFPDSVVGLIPSPLVCVNTFAEYYIRTIRERLSQFAPATAQKNINLGILNDVAFPLPPLEEQHEIVRQVDKLFAFAETVEVHYHKAKAKIDKLPQAMLAKAFRGELVPQDPNDEPAERLLERIQAEKAQQKPKKRRKTR